MGYFLGNFLDYFLANFLGNFLDLPGIGVNIIGLKCRAELLGGCGSIKSCDGVWPKWPI